MGAVLAALVRGAFPARWSLVLICENAKGRMWVAVLGQCVDPGASGVAKAEELGDFVVGLAGGVVEGAADQAVMPSVGRGAGEIEVRVSARDDQGKS